jgi:hypothetical protein
MPFCFYISIAITPFTAMINILARKCAAPVQGIFLRLFSYQNTYIFQYWCSHYLFFLHTKTAFISQSGIADFKLGLLRLSGNLFSLHQLC